jgi:hypothetical protein
LKAVVGRLSARQLQICRRAREWRRSTEAQVVEVEAVLEKCERINCSTLKLYNDLNLAPD